MNNKNMKKEQNVGKMKFLTEHIPEEDRLEFETKMEEMLNNLQEEAFMEGYCYAIKLLQESIGKKKYT